MWLNITLNSYKSHRQISISMKKCEWNCNCSIIPCIIYDNWLKITTRSLQAKILNYLPKNADLSSDYQDIPQAETKQLPKSNVPSNDTSNRFSNVVHSHNHPPTLLRSTTTNTTYHAAPNRSQWRQAQASSFW